MSPNPSTPAAQPARPSPLGAPSATGARVAHACLLALLEILILAALLRLPSRLRRLIARHGDNLPHSFTAAFAPDAPTHAAVIALGIVPDWILPGIRNRGMRPTPALRPPHRQHRPARAPPERPLSNPSPPPIPPRAQNPLPPEAAGPRP
jgi:hypothetical protein